MGETFEEGWCAVRWQTMPWSCALTAHHPCPDRSNTEGSCFSSLSQPLDLSPLAPLLSANHSPSTLSPLGPIPLPLSARFLQLSLHIPSALTQLTGTAYSRHLLQERWQRRSYSALTEADVMALGELQVSAL